MWDDPERYHRAYFARFPGTYSTNDEAVIDDDGHLWVLGRADDVINVAAHRISTLEIEAIADRAPPGRRGCGGRGARRGPRAPCRSPSSPCSTGPTPVRCGSRSPTSVTSQLGGYARLGHVYLTAALPKTRTGKIMRRLLRDVVEHGEPQGDTSAMEDETGSATSRTPSAATATGGPATDVPGCGSRSSRSGCVVEHATTRTVTETDNVLFTTMTMNPQPLHLDAEFASAHRVRRAAGEQPVHARRWWSGWPCRS